MKRKAEGDGSRLGGRRWANALRLGRSPEPKANQIARARTGVRNQTISGPTTPGFAHTGERDRGKHEQQKMSVYGKPNTIEDHQPDPFPTIPVKHSGWRNPDLDHLPIS